MDEYHHRASRLAQRDADALGSKWDDAVVGALMGTPLWLEDEIGKYLQWVASSSSALARATEIAARERSVNAMTRTR